jgi:anti-sigma factor RsiW
MNQTHPDIDRIVDYLHGELSAADDAAMHAHFSECPPCDERRADEAALTDALRSQARANELEFPASVVAAVRARATETHRASLWEQIRTALRPMILVPATAAIAIALYFLFENGYRAAVPTAIDASYYVENHNAMAATAPLAQDAPPVTLTSSDDSR